jgi:carbamoyl-phosphate synthase large subunit
MEKKINLLISSIGRRGYLIKAFKKAMGQNTKLIVTNSNNFATAKKYADFSYIIPNSYESNYFNEIIRICQKHTIKFIISLHDVEIYFLSRMREKFSKYGIKLLIPDDELINISFDKYKMYKWSKRNNLKVPKTYNKLSEFLKDPFYPAIVKNRFGYGSDKIQIVNNKKELKFFFKYFNSQLKTNPVLSSVKAKNYVIIQELITGKEYGLDILNNFNGQYIKAFVLEKLLMRAGETEIATIQKESGLIELGEIIGNKTKHLGIIDIDLIKNEKGYNIIDINPRFGGHYPFFHKTGINVPNVYINWIKNKKINNQELNIKKVKTFYKYLQIIE